MCRNIVLKVIFIFGTISYLCMLVLAVIPIVPFQATKLKSKVIYFSSQSAMIDSTNRPSDSLVIKNYENLSDSTIMYYNNLSSHNSTATKHLGFQILFNSYESAKIRIEKETILHTSVY